MHKRILRAVTVAVAGIAIAVPAATAARNSHPPTAEQLREVGAWAAPSAAKAKKLSRQAIVNEKLAEVGAWAVPSK